MSLVVALAASSALASSHREAPAISLDPAADLTDLYAFISPENPSKIVFILNAIPLQGPGGGPNFHRFDDSVQYNIHCDNEGDGLADKSFTFDFDTNYAYPDEFLYNLGAIDTRANLNQRQSYKVTETTDGVRDTIFNRAPVAPANVGVNSDPNGSYNPNGNTPGSLTASHTITRGPLRVFAGPRQESFYVDLERTFDLLNLANADNTNTLLGLNVHSMAIEMPMTRITRDGQPPSALLQNEVIACWSTATRPQTRTFGPDGPVDSGPRVQVARLGNPLVNEVVIPVGMKDHFNGSLPQDDIQFLSYVTSPILPIYMELILGVTNPIAVDLGLGIGGREDLVLAFLTGHPALGTLPGGFALGGAIPNEAGKVFGAFEALRINLTLPTGFPNGRLVTDDVVDVALSAMGGLLIDGTFVPDGVDATGLNFLTSFPFLGDPWSGDDHPAAFHDLP